MKKVFVDATEPKKIGMLTPSSNTALEPICSNMLHGLEKTVTVHYARFTVTKISLEQDALSQFDFEPMLGAARMLADADVDVIAWNGTSGGWLGFDMDRQLCRKITEETGIPATTSMLAQVEAFKQFGVKRIHMVTPYLQEINPLIAKEYGKCGIEVVNSSCLNQYVNRSFSRVTPDTTRKQFADVMTETVDGVSVVCTNYPAMWLVPELEKQYGTIIFDTINTVVWQAMKMVDVNPGLVTGWGRLFHQ